MSKIPEYDRGLRDGIRRAVTWLHAEANTMNDPKAKKILNLAAFGLSVESKSKAHGGQAPERNTGKQ